MPASVAALLPATATPLASSSWGVFGTELGKTFSADMRATFPGRRMSCDSTVGPELRAELKGDTPVRWQRIERGVWLHHPEVYHDGEREGVCYRRSASQSSRSRSNHAIGPDDA